ncbi:hypothetical protein ABFW00_19095 [Mycobacteroides abscessus]|uniref:hypothetical protein n=1 Tax=Mycobacteroides abscessus TaxID=36809 RepID=UPI0034CFD8EB
MAASTDDTDKPHDFDSLKAELADFASHLESLNELWFQLEDNKYRWDLHNAGLPSGHDKYVVTGIISCLTEALQGLGTANLKLLHAHAKAYDHTPGQTR